MTGQCGIHGCKRDAYARLVCSNPDHGPGDHDGDVEKLCRRHLALWHRDAANVLDPPRLGIVLWACLVIEAFAFALAFAARQRWMAVVDGVCAGVVLGIAFMRGIEWRHGRWLR